MAQLHTVPHSHQPFDEQLTETVPAESNLRRSETWDCA